MLLSSRILPQMTSIPHCLLIFRKRLHSSEEQAPDLASTQSSTDWQCSKAKKIHLWTAARPDSICCPEIVVGSATFHWSATTTHCRRPQIDKFASSDQVKLNDLLRCLPRMNLVDNLESCVQANLLHSSSSLSAAEKFQSNAQKSVCPALA